MFPSHIEQDGIDSGAARKALAGFFVSGLLMSFLGAILPAWGYHLRSEYTIIGDYFLSLNIGILASAKVALSLMGKKGVSFVLVTACLLASSGLVHLAFVAPPASVLLRMAGFLVIGFAAGMLNTAIFHAISPVYRQDPAATINLSGIFFGLGCLMTAALISGTFYAYPVSAILLLLAVVPALFAVMYWRSSFASEGPLRERTFSQLVRDFRSPAAVLFSLLLFFQFGNEWAIAGWLSLFLIQRLGISPSVSLLMLAFYWLALLLGRVLAQWVLPRFRHSRILAASVVSAMLGCIILAFTDNLFGASSGVLLLGLGFASIYPLVVERMGKKFPYYHPGLFNGIFAIALTGGLVAPWSLGFFAERYGMQVVMALPAAGTIAVGFLLLLIWLEAKIGG